MFTAFGHGFSWRDLILIAGGLFLVWKATKEIHHTRRSAIPRPTCSTSRGATIGFAAAIVQILLLDLVFSIDSIITAVGMTDAHRRSWCIAVIVAVGGDAAGGRPARRTSSTRNPTVVMLALGFLLMIGMTLIADGFGVACAEGLHLRRDGVLGPGRGPEHAGAPGAAGAGARTRPRTRPLGGANPGRRADQSTIA